LAGNEITLNLSGQINKFQRLSAVLAVTLKASDVDHVYVRANDTPTLECRLQ
jgi:predicted metalloenzyme YecM